MTGRESESGRLILISLGRAAILMRSPLNQCSPIAVSEFRHSRTGRRTLFRGDNRDNE